MINNNSGIVALSKSSNIEENNSLSFIAGTKWKTATALIRLCYLHKLFNIENLPSLS